MLLKRTLIIFITLTLVYNLSNAQPACPTKSDFTFSRNVCNPLQASFLTNATGYNSIEWKYGDGNLSTGSSNPSYTYSSYGNYQVTMIQYYSTCIDTVTKQITLDLQYDNQLIQTPDTTICYGSTKQLRSQPGLSFCWSPAADLSSISVQNPTTSTLQTKTYYLTSEVTGANLIVNGDFSSGNTGFTSQYNYASNNTTEGQYFVGTNPQAWNASLSHCTDHTTGSGNMMMINGSPTPNVEVWKQTITVTPNTNYSFSTWIQALYPPNPAQLSFSINGKDVGTLITASLPTCTWSQFYTNWNSGSNSTATISIVNKNTIVLGNDFALDDISFAPLFYKRDSVVIKVDTPSVVANTVPAICAGSSVQLNASGANTYSWSPATGLSNATIANPVASPNVTTNYTVTGTSLAGCTATASVNVVVNPSPTINATKSNDISCLVPSSQLNATGGISYSWSPATGLNNTTIANPIATPASTTQYTVTGTSANGCTNTAIITVNVSFIHQSDFSYTQNICNPLAISFKTDSANYNTIEWQFGDGFNATAISNPSHTYSSYNNYTVKMIQTYGICKDTTSKVITVNVQNDPTLIQTPDTLICFGNSKQLRSQPGLSFCWTPSIFLNNTSIQNPVTSTPHNITYYLTSEVTGANLITNGDFSAGNTSFTSQYIFTTTNVNEGEYNVGTNPLSWNPNMSNCRDHTTATGNMLMVNGSPVANVGVWKQTVTVTPNTNYAFSTWIEALHPANPAQLGFSINGKDIGTLITASLPPCTWSQFYTTWNSGNSTVATISIVNKNTIIQGNDFALDDISFAPVFIKRDSVKIIVDTPVVRSIADPTVCAGTSVQLNTTGAVTYSWTPATGLSSSTIANPIATPSTTTQYIVTGTNSNGCVEDDTVMVNIKPKPTITKSADTVICKNASIQIFASGGTTYNWSPAATLNNPNISNPIATPTDSVTYIVTVTGSNLCINTDSVKVKIRSDPVFAIAGNSSICVNNTVQLSASGGHRYTWSPSLSLNNASISNPVATPTTTTQYTVNILDTICSNTANLSTTVTVFQLPNIVATKSNDLDCSNNTSQLNATGGVQYTWSPSSTLNNSSVANPVASPTSSTLYIVTGTDAHGCKNADTVNVDVLFINQGGYLMPSAFTPNNDGLNDCYGIKYWGIIQELDFSIYNRWGERIFHSTKPGECWNGIYKGVPQNPDVYVYLITAKTTCGSVRRKGTFALIR